MKASFASNKNQKWFAVLGCFRVYWHIKGEKLQENKKSIRKRSQLLNQVMGRHKGEGIGTKSIEYNQFGNRPIHQYTFFPDN